MVYDAGIASTETARQLQEEGKNASALEGELDAWEQSQEIRTSVVYSIKVS